jgi:acetyl esterase/lipase
MKIQIVLIILFSIGLQSCEKINIFNKDYKVLEASENAVNYDSKKDLVYGDSKIGQQLDLYIPEGITEKTPVFIMLHSGGWIAGDKQFNNSMIEYFKQKKIRCAIANVNYRLATSPSISYPQQLEDIDLTINFLKQNAELYNLDNRYFLMGFSSGGHLAMLYSYKRKNSEIKAVGGIVAPTDLTDENIHTGVLKEEVKYMMKVPYDEASKEAYQQASPIFNISKKSPPTIVFYGGLDYTIPKSQGDKLVAKLNSFGVENKLVLRPNEQHNWENIDDTLDAILDFVDEYI